MPARKRSSGRTLPPGAWHTTDATWGEAQRVRLTTGLPSLVDAPERVRSVHAVGFVDGDGEGTRVLLVQNKDGSWTFPGGRLEDAETPDQALEREVWEEARARLAPGYIHVAATQIEFINRVPGRVYRFHPSYLLWVAGTVATLSDEPHHDPADYVTGRRIAAVEEAHDLLGPVERSVLEVAVERWAGCDDHGS